VGQNRLPSGKGVAQWAQVIGRAGGEAVERLN
jgi:hypothetical protein